MRAQQIKIYVSHEEHRRLTLAAKRAGVSLSTWMRLTAMTATRPPK